METQACQQVVCEGTTASAGAGLMLILPRKRYATRLDPKMGAYLFLQQAQQQLQAVVRPQLCARTLRAVCHAADEADGKRPQLR